VVARTDQATDPAVVAALAAVRLGTASFRRALSSLSDDDFDAASGLPGWPRRHLVAHVGYNARAVARLVTWAATGIEHPMYSSPQARQQEIELGATLRPQALRSLCEHAAIELDVRWRDLPADHWQYEVVTAQGRHVPVSETLWMRTREVWLHAVDLLTGLRVHDIPDPVKIRLLDDVVGLWSRRGEAVTWRLVESGDAARTWGASPVHGVVQVSGDLSALLAWATGRGTGGRLTWTGAQPQPAPRWL
jgi:maleylpyruvate isomerase